MQAEDTYHNAVVVVQRHLTRTDKSPGLLASACRIYAQTNGRCSQPIPVSPMSSARFPTPVGGTPLPVDFAPSILFAVLYGILSPLLFFRLLDKRSRTVLLIGTAAFAIERSALHLSFANKTLIAIYVFYRIVIYSLRATQARNATKRLSPGLLTYQQISFGLGYIGIANDMVNIVRCLLVNTTFSLETYYQAPPSKDAPLIPKDGESDVRAYHNGSGEFLISGWQRERFTCQPREGDTDYAKRRSTFRSVTGIAGLLFLAGTVPGIIAHQHFGNLLKNTSQANSDFKLRWVDKKRSPSFSLLIKLRNRYASSW